MATDCQAWLPEEWPGVSSESRKSQGSLNTTSYCAWHAIQSVFCQMKSVVKLNGLIYFRINGVCLQRSKLAAMVARSNQRGEQLIIHTALE